MTNYDPYFTDDYDDYTAEFDPLQNDRQARRKRKPKVTHNPKKDRQEIIEEIADPAGLEGGFATTYQPSKYEASWLLQSLRPFYDLNLIDDVLAQVKGGKEASVYRCNAHPATGMGMLAAKVYRPRMFRQLRNDKAYRAGREVLTDTGRAVGKDAERVARAIAKKNSAYGEQVAHTSWLMYEYTTLEHLHALGVPVPKPVQAAPNAILMEYIGDENLAAPPLVTVDLDVTEAQRLCDEVLGYIELMLQHDRVHGDLSAYNILYDGARAVLIDFPQVVNPSSNPQGAAMLQRDITRVCDYFTSQGARCDADAFADDLFQRYLAQNPEDRLADESRFEPEPDED